jgi:hypothetical protein
MRSITQAFKFAAMMITRPEAARGHVAVDDVHRLQHDAQVLDGRVCGASPQAISR